MADHYRNDGSRPAHLGNDARRPAHFSNDGSRHAEFNNPAERGNPDNVHCEYFCFNLVDLRYILFTRWVASWKAFPHNCFISVLMRNLIRKVKHHWRSIPTGH